MDVSFRFDWLFADDARKDTQLHKQQETEDIYDLIEANSLIHFAFWSVFEDGHPVKELWFETQTDLTATIYLAHGGFYRQALTILRPYFETAILGLFYSRRNFYKQPTARYKQWRNGTRNSAADIRKIARSLAKGQTCQ